MKRGTKIHSETFKRGVKRLELALQVFRRHHELLDQRARRSARQLQALVDVLNWLQLNRGSRAMKIKKLKNAVAPILHDLDARLLKPAMTKKKERGRRKSPK